MKIMRCQSGGLSDSLKNSDTCDRRSSFVWNELRKHSTSIIVDTVDSVVVDVVFSFSDYLNPDEKVLKEKSTLFCFDI